MMPKKRLAAKSNHLQPPAAFIAICVLPALILTTYFTLLPTLEAFAKSFTNATKLGLNHVQWVGLENYTYMFSDKRFVKSLLNSLKLMLVVPPVTLAFSLLLATVISQSHLREKAFYRTVFFFPSVLSLTVVGIIWSFIFHPTMGLVNHALTNIGLSHLTHAWLGDSSSALWCIAIALVWQAAGYYMVMHIAAMDSISSEIYEAATIDGANVVDKFFRITLPLIKNIIGITYVLSISGTLALSYTLSRVMTNGGPNYSSTVLLQYIYKMGMDNGSFGYAMAMTVFTTVLSIALSAASRWLTGRSEKGDVAQ